MVGIFFSNKEVNNFNDVTDSKIDIFNQLHRFLLQNNIYFPPSAYEALFISTSHTKEQIDQVINVFEEFCKSL